MGQNVVPQVKERFSRGILRIDPQTYRGTALLSRHENIQAMKVGS